MTPAAGAGNRALELEMVVGGLTRIRVYDLLDDTAPHGVTDAAEAPGD